MSLIRWLFELIRLILVWAVGQITRLDKLPDRVFTLLYFFKQKKKQKMKNFLNQISYPHQSVCFRAFARNSSSSLRLIKIARANSMTLLRPVNLWSFYFLAHSAVEYCNRVDKSNLSKTVDRPNNFLHDSLVETRIRYWTR